MSYFAYQECHRRVGVPYHEGGIGGHPMVAWAYSAWLTWILILAMIAFVKTFGTPPGQVTPALIEKLKQQMLGPKQLEEIEKLKRDRNK